MICVWSGFAWWISVCVSVFVCTPLVDEFIFVSLYDAHVHAFGWWIYLSLYVWPKWFEWDEYTCAHVSLLVFVCLPWPCQVFHALNEMNVCAYVCLAQMFVSMWAHHFSCFFTMIHNSDIFYLSLFFSNMYSTFQGPAQTRNAKNASRTAWIIFQKASQIIHALVK